MVRTDSMWQQVLKCHRNLSRKNLISLAIEVDVVAMEFGMPANRCIEIDGLDLPCRGYF